MRSIKHHVQHDFVDLCFTFVFSIIPCSPCNHGTPAGKGLLCVMFLCVFVAFSILAHLCILPGQDDMGLDATKPVFGVPGKKRLKSVSSA